MIASKKSNDARDCDDHGGDAHTHNMSLGGRDSNSESQGGDNIGCSCHRSSWKTTSKRGHQPSKQGTPLCACSSCVYAGMCYRIFLLVSFFHGAIVTTTGATTYYWFDSTRFVVNIKRCDACRKREVRRITHACVRDLRTTDRVHPDPGLRSRCSLRLYSSFRLFLVKCT